MSNYRYRSLLFFVIASSIYGRRQPADPALPRAAANVAVVHITAGDPISGSSHGSGLCLDTPCIHVLTNYHVAETLGRRMKVEGVGVAEVILGTGPGDEGARVVEFAATEKAAPLRFNPGRDLALLTLERPLGSAYSGVTFASYQPRVSQNVRKIAHRGPAYDVAAGTIVSLDLELRSRTSGGQEGLRLRGYLLTDFASQPGNSGGIICDSDGLVLGIIAMGIQDQDGRMIQTMAIPASGISTFLRQHNTRLWSRLFAPPILVESKIVPAVEPEPRPSAPVTEIIGGHAENQRMVQALRDKAASNAEILNHVIAEESVIQWGAGTKKQRGRYEVAIYSNREELREIHADGTPGNEIDAVPLPRQGVRPGKEWRELLEALQDAPLQYRGVGKHQGQDVHIYEFTAKASDRICSWREEQTDKRAGQTDWNGYVGCSWRIVADARFNTLNIHREMLPGSGRLAVVVKVDVSYDFTTLPDGTNTLVPASLKLASQFQNGKWYFASALWRNYHQFRAESNLVASATEAPHPLRSPKPSTPESARREITFPNAPHVAARNG